jgi:competence protein ComGC
MEHNVCSAHKMNGAVWLKILNSVEIIIIIVVVVVVLVLRVPNRNFRDFISFNVDFK